jgi:acyl-CoA synthetase (NDP forming)
LEDERVTALGLHIEGIGDFRAFEAMAARACAGQADRGAEGGRVGTGAHGGAVAYRLAGGSAMRAHGRFWTGLGIARVETLSQMLETLKLLHVAGPLASAGSRRCPVPAARRA